jgi:hypothetical protein
MRLRIVVAALAAIVIAAPACAGSDGESAPSTPAATGSPTGATASEASPTTSASPTPAAELEDGRHFGYIDSIDPDASQIRFDLAYLLTGDEANQAAAERGKETPVPNDYFIVNDNPKLRTLPVAAAVVLDLVDWKECCEKRFAGDPARFETNFTAESPPSGRYRGRFSAYWLTVEDGLVTRIEEQYLP